MQVGGRTITQRIVICSRRSKRAARGWQWKTGLAAGGGEAESARHEARGERQQAAENKRAEVDDHLNYLEASVPRTAAGGLESPFATEARSPSVSPLGCAAGVEYDIDTGLYEHLYPREPTSRM